MKKITTIMLAVIYTANIMAQVPNYVPTNGLVGWWPFNGNANDESGNGNNGTVNGATLITDRFGNANKAYSFDGIDDFIEAPSNSGLQLSAAYSIGLWFKANVFYNGQYGYTLISKIQSTNWYGGYEISIGETNSIGGVSHTGNINGNFQLLNTGLYSGSWYNVIVTFNGTQLKLYINGNLVDTINQSGALQTGNDPLRFGRRGGGGIYDQWFNGIIDDIGIWNRALTQQEITRLYDGGCGKNLAISPTNNSKMIGTNATFTATVSDTNPSYIWQSDFGQGFQTLNNMVKYSGTTTNTMSISNVQLSNHMEPIRAISVSGNCRDTSNIAYVKITDTCITKINDTIKITKYDTIKVTKYDTITTKITKYDTIKVMDTLVINATLSGVSAPNNTNRLLIYPNPAKDHITIDYGVFSRMNGYTLKIVNTLGQTVFSSLINQQSSYINLSTWTGKGMYNVQIFDTQNNMIENRKIVLQ
jgi:hypothetical protein